MAEVRWHQAASEVIIVVPVAIADRIIRATRMLEQFPALGMPVQDPDWPNMRRLLVRGWNVVYAYDSVADLVTVIAIVPPGTSGTIQ